ncbi:hypothetical protein GF391_02600 [Candidatus Uhrbacteria bacterium]|nr:hypothetical protein [Candidatus Uhrbacteria bacterium]
MKTLYFQILSGEIKAVLIEDNKKIVVLGIFPVKGKSQTAFKDEISRIKKELKLKQEPIIILPEPGLYPNSQNWKLSKNQVSSALARASYEAHKGQFKKQGTYLLLEIGNSVNLAVINKSKQVQISEHCLDRLVADFREAISEPHDSRYLQDFCSNQFFLKKTDKSALDIYNQLQDDALDGAELFVEYGANMGALLANLDTLYEPNCIAICGSIAQTFDAWSHAMGKMRNQHRAKKPACRAIPLKDKSDSTILGANLLN